jgi:hypothetical protein
VKERYSVADFQRMARSHNYKPQMGEYDAAMSFDEIAVALGTDKQHVWHWYATAIRKLRRNPDILHKLLGIADHLAAERDKREIVE